jgi:hypothetical protein
MPFVLSAQTLLALLVSIHIYRSGAPRWWILVVLAFPVIGVLAYLFLEVLSSNDLQRTGQRIIKKINPSVDLRRRLDDVKVCGSTENKLQAASECIDCGLFDDAVAMLESAKTSHFENDPKLLYALAEAYSYQGRFDQAISSLEPLMQTQPAFRDWEAKLLYAQSLNAAGRFEQAQGVFTQLVDVYPGLAARYWYAQALEKRGQPSQARAQYEEIVAHGQRGPSYYRRSQRGWVKSARDALQRMPVAA